MPRPRLAFGTLAYVRLYTLGAAVALVLALSAGLAGAGSSGGAPPEWAGSPGGWPSHNRDLSNTRADFDTQSTRATSRR